MDTSPSERYAKIDALLLNLSSALGILFSLAQVAMADVNSTGGKYTGVDIIFLFVPLLLLGWFLPIYFGYIRGAMRGYNEERIRGWAYLIDGALIYLIHVVLDVIYQRCHIDPLDILGWSVRLLATFPVFMIAMLYQHKFTGWIIGVSEEEIGPGMLMVSRSTQSSAFMLATGFEFLVRSYFALPSGTSPSVLFSATFSMAMIALGGLFFWVSGQWSVISRNIEAVRLEERATSWSSMVKAILIGLVSGGMVFASGAALFRSSIDLGSLLMGFGFFLAVVVSVVSLLETSFVVQIETAQVGRMPEKRSKELLTAIHWIQRIG